MTRVAPPLTERQAARIGPLGLLADDPPGLRTAWGNVQEMWGAIVERARLMPSRNLDARVNDEWSFLETLRHLIFVTDAWIGSVVLEHPRRTIRSGCRHTSSPTAPSSGSSTSTSDPYLTTCSAAEPPVGHRHRLPLAKLHGRRARPRRAVLRPRRPVHSPRCAPERDLRGVGSPSVRHRDLADAPVARSPGIRPRVAVHRPSWKPS